MTTIDFENSDRNHSEYALSLVRRVSGEDDARMLLDLICSADDLEIKDALAAADDRWRDLVQGPANGELNRTVGEAVGKFPELADRTARCSVDAETGVLNLRDPKRPDADIDVLFGFSEPAEFSHSPFDDFYFTLKRVPAPRSMVPLAGMPEERESARMLLLESLRVMSDEFQDAVLPVVKKHMLVLSGIAFARGALIHESFARKQNEPL